MLQCRSLVEPFRLLPCQILATMAASGLLPDDDRTADNDLIADDNRMPDDDRMPEVDTWKKWLAQH